jgi:hypothetical protein
LVAAAFTHTSSRALDPQLHTPLTVFNATFDESEHCWKALQAGGMYDAIRYGTAVYTRCAPEGAKGTAKPRAKSAAKPESNANAKPKPAT